jgi:hypothetical protein
VIAWEANAGLNQRFAINRVSTGAGVRYAITSLHSGLALTTSGGQTIQSALVGTGSPDQLWQAVADAGGAMLINDAGQALSVSGTALVPTTPTSAISQVFGFSAIPPLAKGNYRIYTPAGFRFDISGGLLTNGANLLLYRANSGQNQVFKLDCAIGGATALISAQSSKALDITGASTADGANIAQWTPIANAANQTFYPVPAGDGWFVLKTGLGTWVAATSDSSSANIYSTTDQTQALKVRFEWVPLSATGIPELDAKIASIKANIIGSDGDVLRRCFNYVAFSYSYRSGSTYPTGNWAPPFALEMINYGSGNCYRFAALFCVLAQSYGYDARVIAGQCPSAGGGWTAHGWVEIRLNGTTYICDPDMANAMPGYNWYMVTYGQAPMSYSH